MKYKVLGGLLVLIGYEMAVFGVGFLFSNAIGILTIFKIANLYALPVMLGVAVMIYGLEVLSRRVS